MGEEKPERGRETDSGYFSLNCASSSLGLGSPLRIASHGQICNCISCRAQKIFTYLSS